MSSDDIIPTIVAIIAVLFMFVNIYNSIKASRQDVPDYEDDEDEEELPKPVKIVRKQAPPVAPVRHIEPDLPAQIELVSDAVKLAESEGSVMIRPKKASVHDLIKSLPQEKLLLISYEVFKEPVCKRKSPFPWNG